MDESRPPGLALRGHGDDVQVIQGSSVLFVIPADVVRRSAVLGAIVRQQEERYTSLDATQISDWISFPQVLPSQLLQLVSLLKARSLRCTKPNRNSRRGGVCTRVPSTPYGPGDAFVQTELQAYASLLLSRQCSTTCRFPWLVHAAILRATWVRPLPAMMPAC